MPKAVASSGDSGVGLHEPKRTMHVASHGDDVFSYGGSAVHRGEAGATLLGAGRLVIISPGRWHAYTPEPDLSAVVARIGTGLVRSTPG